jgi:hypothetical protein
MQVSIEDVATLVAPKIVQQQVQVGGDVGETSVANVDKVEADLEKNILMIKKQEDVIPLLMLEEENTNEDVKPHAQIDGGYILNFLYNFLPYPSSQVERMGGVFLSIFLLQYLC